MPRMLIGGLGKYSNQCSAQLTVQINTKQYLKVTDLEEYLASSEMKTKLVQYHSMFMTLKSL